ncbi:MAG: cadherin-like domain-containing protein, partial [Planctomycetaceae bacterium]|nr:cadherin-like domain-containing protein [Planctomycetaceae bacterium]
LRFDPLEERQLLAVYAVDYNGSGNNPLADSIDATIYGGSGTALDPYHMASLRGAILATNAAAGADTIQLPDSVYTLTINGRFEDAAATGDLDITGALTIIGASQNGTIIQAGASAASGIDRVFEVLPGGDATFQSLTIQHGNAWTVSEDGGGINANGNNFSGQNAVVALSHVTVRDNIAGRGAGINNNLATSNTTLTITDSTITGNEGHNRGGGLGVGGFGTLYLTRSTVSDNSTTELAGGIALHTGTSGVITSSAINGNTTLNTGGGILTFGGSNPLTIINSTISGNTARESSGGIHADADLTIINSTITGNNGDIDNNGSGIGGGIIIGNRTQTIYNSIIAGNFKGTTASDIENVGDTINTAANNIIGNASTSSGINHGVSGNIVGNGGSGTINIASVLNTTLANNGGGTLTHALATNSLALNAGNNAWLPTDAQDLDSDLDTSEALPVDQRGIGFPRVQATIVDIGAYEANVVVNNDPMITAPASTTTAEDSTAAICGISVTDSDTANLSLTITAAHGVLNVGGGGATVTGNGTANLTLSGSIANLNTTLSGLQFAPATDYHGTASVTIAADDLNGGTDNKTVAITITEVNDAPVLANDNVTNIAEDSGPYSIALSTLLSNDATGPASESGQTLTVTAVGSAIGGTVQIVAGNAVFTPTLDFSGSASFQYTVRDNGQTNGLDDFRTATATASFTITDVVDPTLSFLVASQSTAGETGSVQVIVVASSPLEVNLTVPAVIGGSAASPGDYTLSGTSFFFPIGSTSAAITLTVAADQLDEANETVTFGLNVPAGFGGVGSPTTHTVTILDNDAPPLVQFTAISQNVLESTNTARAIVRLSQASSFDVTVPVTIGGTAGGGDASVTTALPVIIPAGQTSAAIDVSIVDDPLPEPAETILMTLGSPINGTLGAVNTHTVTILDNDAGVSVQLATATMTVNEAGGSFPVSVTLSSLATNEIVVPLNFAGTATTKDYNVSEQEVRIPAGQTRATFTILLTDDQLDELTETIVVSLGPPSGGASFGTPITTTITIDDNDPVVSFARGSDITTDAAGTVTVVAETVSPVIEAISIPFAVVSSASNPADYTISANQFDFASGASTAAITITINADGVVEPLEFITLRLTPPPQASLGSGQQYTLYLADAGTVPGPGLDLNGAAPGQDHLSPAADFVEDAGGITLVPAATLVPPGVQTLTSVTVFLETAPNGSAESLTASGFGGATVTAYNPTTRTLTISGGSTSDQQTALRSLTYQNSSQNPSAGSRFVSVTATFSGSSETRRRKITVTPHNDAPIITLTGGSTSYVTGNSAVAIDAGLAISDVDSTSLTSVVVTLTDYETGDLLTYTPRAGLSYRLEGDVLTISGSASVSYYAGALQLLRFSTTSVSDGTRTASIVATDLSRISGVPNMTATVFKSLSVQSPLQLAASSVLVDPTPERLTDSQLQPLVTEAIARWQAAGLGVSQLAVLQATTVELRDLQSPGLVGLGGGNQINLDDNAAGAGWFIDNSPSDDSEFSLTDAIGGLRAPGINHIDLLTVVIHEMGHILGLSDVEGDGTDVMVDSIVGGVRRSVSDRDLQALNLSLQVINERNDRESTIYDQEALRAEVFARWS